ncbi:MAG: ergothioneine biosynthesis protein EgtB [Acidobacteriota bacterium]
MQLSPEGEPGPTLQGVGAAAYAAIRAASLDLCKPLSPEDCAAQSMTDASPLKWHLAHTTWFFETFVLERVKPGYRPFHPGFHVLFNSYYQAVGAQYPRPQRGLLTRPSLADVIAYREQVDRSLQDILERPRKADPIDGVIALGLQHEQQHQELMLTDLKHLLSFNPLQPAYRTCPSPAVADPSPPTWLAYDGGPAWIGHAGPGFAFDNEGPRHQTHIERFELASRAATAGEYLAFMEDGGYRDPTLWLADGWAAVQEHRWDAPLYWEQRDGSWFQITLAGLRELRADLPVCHVSFYEADAFARWCGARLPEESEWEIAARDLPVKGNFVESGLLHPEPPSGKTAPEQVFGNVWEWTRTPYTPYPGYRPPPGAVGEYNGKFMCNQMVLRGGSCASPRSHLRATYRNFLYPRMRWQFSGIRLARDPR